MPVGEVFRSWDHLFHPLTINSEQARKANSAEDPNFWAGKKVTLGFHFTDLLISFLGLGLFSLPIYLLLTAKRKVEATSRFKEIYTSLIKPGEDSPAIIQRTVRVSNKVLKAGLEGSDSGDYIRNAHREENTAVALEVFNLTRNIKDIEQTITAGYSLDTFYQLLRNAYELELFQLSEERTEIIEEDGEEKERKYFDKFTPLFYLLNNSNSAVTISNLSRNPHFNVDSLREWINIPNPQTNDNNKDIYSVLHFAASKKEGNPNYKVMIDFLIRVGANINEQDRNDGFTPLHRACGTGNSDAIEAFLNYDNIDTTLVSKYGKRPVMQAVLSGQSQQIIELMLQHKSNSQRLNLVQMVMLDKGVKDNSKSRLARLGQLNDLGHCEKADLDHVNANHQTALHLAVIEGEIGLVRELLKLGANPAVSANGETPAQIARRNGRNDIAELLEKYATNEEGGRAPSIFPEPMRAYFVDGARIDVLLEGNNLELRDKEFGFTPLQYACRIGDLDTIKAILDSGVDPCKKDVTGISPMMFVVKDQFPKSEVIIQMMVDHPSNVKKNSPLHLILMDGGFGKFNQLRNLLNRSTSYLGHINSENKLPLHYAVQLGLDFVREIVERWQIQSFNNLWPILDAALRNDEEGKNIVEYLLHKMPNITQDSVLHIAINADPDLDVGLRIQRLKRLIALGYNDANNNNTIMNSPVHFAAMRSVEFMDEVLKLNPDIEGNAKETPIGVSIETANRDVKAPDWGITKLLIERGADLSKAINPSDEKTLFEYELPLEVTSAIISVYPSEILRYLFRKDAMRNASDFEALVTSQLSEINVTDAVHGRTALHWACRLRDYDAVKILLKAGARIDIRSNEGRIALMDAHKSKEQNRGNKERVVALMLRHATYWSANLKELEHNVSPLHRAAGLPIEYSKLLLKKGVHVDGHGKAFKTPMLLALEKGRWDLVKLLLQYGANPDTGRKPVKRERLRFMAQRAYQHEVLALL